MVDAGLHDEHRVGREQLARRGVDRVEDDYLRAAEHVVEPHEDHRVALLSRQLLDRRDDPRDGDDLAVAAALELGERRVGLAPQLLSDRLERVLADVEPERLLLQPQQVVLLELLRPDRRVRRLLVGLGEERLLPAQALVLRALPVRERVLERLEHPAARAAGRVERPTLDQRLERALVHDLRVDPLGELPERRERRALVTRRDDRPRGRIADVFDRVQPEPDPPLDDREVALREVHVRRQDVDPHLTAGVDVERHAVLRVHHGRDQCRHVLVRVVRLQPGRPVGG